MFGRGGRINSALDAGDRAAAAPLVAAWRTILSALGLEVRADAGEVPEHIVELARRRDAARAAKDWATADALRDEIASAGFTVEDGPDGTVVLPA